jgi:hypothetical protein
MSLTRTSTALGAFYRRLAARAGKAKAITATARKLAVLVYRTLSGNLQRLLTTSSTADANSNPCANAPTFSVATSSTAPPEKCSSMRTLLLDFFLREAHRPWDRVEQPACGLVDNASLLNTLISKAMPLANKKGTG